MVTEKYKGPTYGPVRYNTNSIKNNNNGNIKSQPMTSSRKTTTSTTTKRRPPAKKSTVTHSFSDSNLLPQRVPQSSSSNSAKYQERSTTQHCYSQQKLRKPSVSLSETQQQFNPAVRNKNHHNKASESKSSSRSVNKISTNSTRLIQQFPNKFCSDTPGEQGSNQLDQVPSNAYKAEVISGGINQCFGDSGGYPPHSSVQRDQQQQHQQQQEHTNMFATEGTNRPLSLLEQKKQQWAREREELNGLWSPWGRPISGRSRLAATTTATYVNKLQTSSIQSVLRSEYHLPPIANNNNNNGSSLSSPASRQAQLKSSTLWTCDMDKEMASMYVHGRSTLPICINATTGEVLYNRNKGSSSLEDDSRDTLHVNNVVISSGGGHQGALSIKSLNKERRNHNGNHGTQQQANSASSANGWSSVDEEAFTSGYHSEVNGSLSNSEDCSGSRKGSGSDTVGCRREGPNVIIHNIQVEPKLEVPDRVGGLTISREKIHHGSEKRSRLHQNPPPPAMRSSITVGLDSGLHDDYRELQKLEKERWLHELEKQREEQRLRRQLEKDEKRPKWGDKGIGVGHFWEPSSSNDNLPQQPARDDPLARSPPAWLEKGLSRLQNSVSQPSLYDAANSGDAEFQGPGSLFTNQSTMDLRNVSGLDDTRATAGDSGGGSERSYLLGNAAPTSETDAAAERERKRREALEHQAAIRKQIEERQQRLKEERERRLQEELEDEEKAKLHRLRELEHIELEARRMGMAHMQQSEESEDTPSLTETKEVRKTLTTDGRASEKESNDGRASRETVRSNVSEGRRRLSLDGSNQTGTEVTAEPKVSTVTPPYLTSSQSMVNISTSPAPRNHKSEPEDVGFPSNSSSLHREPKDERASQRSRSLSSHREFGTQTEQDAADKKNSQKHRSHNCLVKGSKDKGGGGGGTTAEELEVKKKQEKPRWGATQNKKQYMKQSEKDPMYQQRLKRRMERIKKFEERLNAANAAMTGQIRGMDTGTESDNPNYIHNNNALRARSPPTRSRNRQTHVGTNAETKSSPRKQAQPLKATARIQVSHKPPQHPNETPRKNAQDGNNNRSNSRTRKIFPDIPGRTIGPLNSAANQEFDGGFRMNNRRGSLSENSSRFSSPSMESMSSRNVETHHYVRQRVAGDSVEVDLESRISTRSLEIRYEGESKSEVSLTNSPPKKKTVIESHHHSSDEVTYRKTVINQSSAGRVSEHEELARRNETVTSRSMSNPPPPSRAKPSTEVPEKPPQPPPSPPIRVRNPTNNAPPTITSAEKARKSKSDSRQRRVPPPKAQISSTDIDTEVADEKKTSTTDRKKKPQRAAAKTPIGNPLVGSISPLVSPVPHNNVPYPSRTGSPPVPAVLKKLQAGVPIEDLPVCDDPLYEVPRAQTAGSTSNGYKSVESDSSTSNAPPLLSRFSSNAALEIDIDPAYELSSIRIGHSPHHNTHTEEDTEHTLESFDHGLPKGSYDDEEDDDDHKGALSLPTILATEETASDDKEEEIEKKFKYSFEDDEDEEDYESGKITDGFEDPVIYPYPIPRISPRLKSQHSLSPPTSPVMPRLSGRTTTLEVMADYRKFTLPEYDYDSVKLFPHVDVDGMDVTVHNLRRPGTQDTDLSKREQLISYVINNQDVQAQISARDSELSEKGIIEFNVRLPVNDDDDAYMGSGGGDYDDYKDPLLSDRQRATIRWLYSSDSNSSSKDSILTHLSYLKKGIQQQQHEWNVLPSDTEEETESYGHNNYSGSTNENSSDDNLKYFRKS